MPGGSRSGPGDVVERGKGSDVTIYTVGFVAEGRGVNKDFLEELAGETGGRAFFPVNVEHLERSFSAIGKELHTRYRLAYMPVNGSLDGQWRVLEVRIPAHPDLVVRSRRGYYAGVPGPASSGTRERD